MIQRVMIEIYWWPHHCQREDKLTYGSQAIWLFLQTEMPKPPSFSKQLKQYRARSAQLAKQRAISELIQTIKAVDLIGADSSKYRNKLRILIAAKSNVSAN